MATQAIDPIYYEKNSLNGIKVNNDDIFFDSFLQQVRGRKTSVITNMNTRMDTNQYQNLS